MHRSYFLCVMDAGAACVSAIECRPASRISKTDTAKALRCATIKALRCATTKTLRFATTAKRIIEGRRRPSPSFLHVPQGNGSATAGKVASGYIDRFET